jgi:hypothetical protein
VDDDSAQIILFLEMLKFFYLNNFSKKFIFVKENEESKFEIIILNFFSHACPIARLKCV